MTVKRITSLKHPLVKHWVRLKNNSRYRKTEERALLEGKNCIADLAKKIPIKRFIATHEWPDIQAEEHFLVSSAIFKKISGVDEKQGCIAEVEIKKTPSKIPMTRLLVCDKIQDPGNLGTLIRTACALGWDAVFLLHGTCDPFNDKALRAAKGATFSMPLLSGSWYELCTLCQKNALSLIVADVTGEPLDKQTCTDGIALGAVQK